MTTQLKSEFRKLITVRSTYLMVALTVVLMILIFGYGNGYRGGAQASPQLLDNSLLNLASFTSFFAMIIGILMMGHEYRYNTITYTLVNSPSRTKVLLAKIVVLTIFCGLLTALAMVFGLGGIAAGAELAGRTLPTQNIDLLAYFAKAYFFVAGTGLAGMLFATYIRNMIAAFAIFIILPNLIETLANLLIKEKSVYMPFTALNEVVINVPPDIEGLPFVFGDLSPLKGALVFLAYLVPGWLIGWYLFLRRDAV